MENGISFMENRMEHRISFMENVIFMENVCHFKSKKDTVQMFYCKNWKCVSFLKQERSY